MKALITIIFSSFMKIGHLILLKWGLGQKHIVYLRPPRMANFANYFQFFGDNHTNKFCQFTIQLAIDKCTKVNVLVPDYLYDFTTDHK